MGIFQRRFIYLSEVFLFRGQDDYIRYFLKSNFFTLHNPEKYIALSLVVIGYSFYIFPFLTIVNE